MSTDSVDVVIVGAGPSGAVVAHTLASKGFSVTCLEQGDWVGANDFATNYPEWELLGHRRFSHHPNVRQLPADYPMNVEAADMSPTMWNGVGGGSLYFGAEWPRLTPSDFRVRTLDGVADDWPIGYDDVTPFHQAVGAFIGITGLEDDPAYPAGQFYPQPPLPIGRAGRRAAEGMNKMGWHWWPGDQAIPSYRIKNLEPCARYGVCERGCPNGSKASFDIAYWPHALAAGAKLRTGARVSRIVTNDGGRATGVEWIDRHGTQHLERGNAVVVCANGVGTPRLLLLSASPQHPDGLANSSGLVGKNLMLHPNCGVTGYYEDELQSWLGPAGQLIASMQFYETDPRRGLVRGAKWQALPTPGPLSAVQTHQYLAFDDAWGANFHRIAATHGHGFLWAANIEDLPEEHNRVTLDPDLKDADGIPAPKIDYRISANTRGLMRFTVARMIEAHEAGGAVETVPVEHRLDSPGHILGTARMGDDPGSSVVNPFGRTHDVPNLYVADGSIFVTSGAVNPTSTITALALRTATHISEIARHERVVA